MPWRKYRRHIPWLVFFAVLSLSLFLHRCSKSVKPVSIPEPPPIQAVETSVVVAPKLDTIKPLVVRRGASRRAPTTDRPTEPAAAIAKSIPEPVDGPDTLPYVFPNPWGGRHFDSVTVGLFCREDCLILYSLEDSINLRSYEKPFTFRRNATLWFAGVSARGSRTLPRRLDYVIEKNPGNCAGNSMPVSVAGREVCVDIFEWPNLENAQPRAMVNRNLAEDSCRAVGKHLCSLEEWRSACEGPEQSQYPYGEDYDERHCPAQQAVPSRSGRLPACRSYYGIYDLTGNLWEWTSSVNPDHDGFYYVAGGNWESAGKADCRLAKYSFYPQNSYPMVGFRCCAKAK